jgi:hypothetical protein
VKGLNDLTVKWDFSKLTLVAYSEEAEHFFKKILLPVSEPEKLYFVF